MLRFNLTSGEKGAWWGNEKFEFVVMPSARAWVAHLHISGVGYAGREMGQSPDEALSKLFQWVLATEPEDALAYGGLNAKPAVAWASEYYQQAQHYAGELLFGGWTLPFLGEQHEGFAG